jgi:hypothetical protein
MQISILTLRRALFERKTTAVALEVIEPLKPLKIRFRSIETLLTPTLT